ncbi:glycosyltransferase 87 family protein [Actinoplanes solisilvae]|uniref:glycosyltransferase 87 family protein n=1 Tax=Actinoplanes solisilvae TaxID=2486853 RepID=UPI0013E2C7D0|nr:glycosyltransferase 87 family protein [Actinoplanes solisilvae]
MEHSERTFRPVVIGLGCLAVLWATGHFLHTYGVQALAVDHEAIRAWLAGDDLYGLGTAHPPTAALLLAPAAALPLTVAAWLLALAGVAALILAVIALAGPVARRYGRARGPAVAVAAAVALMTEPVRATLGLGHLDLLIFGLIVADLVALRRAAWARRRATWWPGTRPGLERSWSTGAWAGLGIGIASALAVGPVLFIVHLAVTRQWRPALTAASTAATLTLGALLITPGATGTWFSTALAQVDRAGPISDPANQSLAGLLARLNDSTGTPVLVWISFAALLVAVGLIRARAAHADGDEITAFTLVGLAGAATAPVTTGHELFWVLPAMLILVDAAARLRRPRASRFAGIGYAAAALVVYLLLVLPTQMMVDWNAYAFAVIALMNGLPWRPGVAPTTTPARRPVAPVRVPAIPGPRGS